MLDLILLLLCFDAHRFFDSLSDLVEVIIVLFRESFVADFRAFLLDFHLFHSALRLEEIFPHLLHQ